MDQYIPMAERMESVVQGSLASQTWATDGPASMEQD